jgi:hypothetical protein
MAPRTKFSAEEIDFMKTFHDQFLDCKAKRNYEPMWNPFFEAWAAKFPEHAVVFKDIPLDVDLTEEQSAVVSKAWALRQQVRIFCSNINFDDVLLTMLIAPHRKIS